MDEAPRARSRYVLPLFLLALLSVVMSVAFFVLVVAFQVSSITGGDAAPARAGVRTPIATPTPGPLLVRGSIPGAVPDLQLQQGEPADIAVTPSTSATATAIRYWALVVSPSAGLPDLTADQVTRLLEKPPEASSLGGRGGRIAGIAGPERPGEIFRATWPVEESPPTWEDLRRRMAEPGRPAIAVIPIDEVDPRTAVVRRKTATGAAEPVWIVERVEVTGLTGRGQAAAQTIVRAIEVAKPEATTIIATGDILLSRCTYTTIEAIDDWAAPFASTLGARLRGADLVLGSLDGSIQDINPVWGCVATTNLAMPPEAVRTLLAGGIDGVTLATNHALDCGQDSCGRNAVLRTIALLDAAGVKHTGGGATLEDALAPMIFEIGGVRIGVLGFDDIAAEDSEATATSPGTAPLDDSYEDEQADFPREPAFYKPASLLNLTRFAERIRKLKTEVDLVIVQVQSGTEDTHDPSPRSIKALRAAVDAGADLVVGNQAHWVQAAEFRGDTFVAYALGNFLFDQRHTPQHYQGVLLEAEVWGKKIAQVRLVPYEIIDRHRPEILEGAVRAKVLNDVWAASERLLAEAP
ncbi:MAG: CapA family protein [Dehalococcoidia bacterium]